MGCAGGDRLHPRGQPDHRDGKRLFHVATVTQLPIDAVATAAHGAAVEGDAGVRSMAGDTHDIAQRRQEGAARPGLAVRSRGSCHRQSGEQQRQEEPAARPRGAGMGSRRRPVRVRCAADGLLVTGRVHGRHSCWRHSWPLHQRGTLPATGLRQPAIGRGAAGDVSGGRYPACRWPDRGPDPVPCGDPPFPGSRRHLERLEGPDDEVFRRDHRQREPGRPGAGRRSRGPHGKAGAMAGDRTGERGAAPAIARTYSNVLSKMPSACSTVTGRGSSVWIVSLPSWPETLSPQQRSPPSARTTQV